MGNGSFAIDFNQRDGAAENLLVALLTSPVNEIINGSACSCEIRGGD